MKKHMSNIFSSFGKNTMQKLCTICNQLKKGIYKTDTIKYWAITPSNIVKSIIVKICDLSNLIISFVNKNNFYDYIQNNCYLEIQSYLSLKVISHWCLYFQLRYSW